MLRPEWRPISNRRARKLRKRGEDVRWFNDDYYFGYRWKPTVIYPYQQALMRMLREDLMTHQVMISRFMLEKNTCHLGFDLASGPDKTVYYMTTGDPEPVKAEFRDRRFIAVFDEEVNDHGQPSPVLPEKKV